MWTFRLPSLAERKEDIAPNLDFELDKAARVLGTNVTANFRDFNAAVMRMATLAPGGRIDTRTVDDEVARLRGAWLRGTANDDGDDLVTRLLGRDQAAQLDRFERVQLHEVLHVCRRSPSLSAAGRELFASSRTQKQSTNDADRLRKYLARFSLNWASLHIAAPAKTDRVED